MTRVIVCGGRNYRDRERVYAVLHETICNLKSPVVVHGACPGGVDLYVAYWCRANLVEQETHPSNWKKYGRAAGPIRNKEMADAGAALCIAFPGGTGTRDMTIKATQAGIPVRHVE